MKNNNGLWCGKFVLVAVPFMLAAEVHAGDVAILDEIQGTVMIDRGEGYSIAHRGEVLQKGDRVVTMDASGAILKHNDGCIAQLAENSMVKMEHVSVCKSNNGSLKKSGPFVAAAIGVRPSKKIPTAKDSSSEPIFEGAEQSAFEEPAVGTATESAGAGAVTAATNAGVLAGVSTSTMIAIGVGAAAVLAAVAGGGGSSTTNH